MRPVRQRLLSCMLICILCALAAFAVPAEGEPRYLLPEGEELTEERLPRNNYALMGLMMREIPARHGCLFEPGDRYDVYFRDTGWYRPREDGDTLSAYAELTDAEWHNLELLRQLRAEQGFAKEGDPGMMDPAFIAGRRMIAAILEAEDFAAAADTPSRNIQVFTAPDTEAFVPAEGTLETVENRPVEMAGRINGFVFVRFQAKDGSLHTGYVPEASLGEAADGLPELTFVYLNGRIQSAAFPWTSYQLYDDPAGGNCIARLPRDAKMTLLFYYGNDIDTETCSYVESRMEGRRVRGFVKGLFIPKAEDDRDILSREEAGRRSAAQAREPVPEGKERDPGTETQEPEGDGPVSAEKQENGGVTVPEAEEAAAPDSAEEPETQDSAEKPEPPDSTEDPADAARYSFVGENDLYLYLSESQFHVSRPATPAYTVLYGEKVQEDILVRDETGKVILTIPRDGTGFQRGTLPLDTERPRAGTLTAESGQSVSPKVTYYIQPEITAARARQFGADMEELESFVLLQSFGDPGGEEALRQVQAHLAENPRIAKQERRGQTLFFVTEDGMMGCYNAPLPSAREFGTPGLKEAWEMAESLGTRVLPEEYIHSNLVLTNGRVLAVSPQDDNKVIRGMSLFLEATGSRITEAVNAQFDDSGHGGTLPSWTEIRTGDAARNLLMQGDFTDCGFLFLQMHGDLIEGTTRASFTLGESDSALQLYLQYADSLWADNRADNFAETSRGYYSLTVDRNQRVHRKISLTTNYLAYALRDRIFDNTLVYMNICYAMADGDLTGLFLSHGASAVVGCMDSMDFAYSLFAISELVEHMCVPDESGIYGTLPAALNDVAADSGNVLALYRQGEAGSAGLNAYRAILDMYREDMPQDTADPDSALAAQLISDYQKAVQEGRLIGREFRSGEAKQQVLGGAGTVSGLVMSEDQQSRRFPLEDAELHFYRWFNHCFAEDERFRMRTGQDGKYSAEDLPFGLWVLEARYGEEAKAFTVLEHANDRSEADPILMKLYLEGKVVTQLDCRQNAPAAGAVVRAVKNGTAYSTVTDAEGYYRFQVHPGRYALTAEYADQSGLMTADSCGVELTQAGHTAPVMTCGYTESGHVYDAENGQLLSGVTVQAATRLYQTGGTDDSGFWYANTDLNGANVRFSKAGYRDTEVWIQGLPYEQSYDFDVTMERLPEEKPTQLYADFLRGLAIRPGLASLEEIKNWTDPRVDRELREIIRKNGTGLISAVICDTDQDEVPELITLSAVAVKRSAWDWERQEKTEHQTILYRLDLYRIRDGAVCRVNSWTLREVKFTGWEDELIYQKTYFTIHREPEGAVSVGCGTSWMYVGNGGAYDFNQSGVYYRIEGDELIQVYPGNGNQTADAFVKDMRDHLNSPYASDPESDLVRALRANGNLLGSVCFSINTYRTLNDQDGYYLNADFSRLRERLNDQEPFALYDPPPYPELTLR